VLADLSFVNGLRAKSWEDKGYKSGTASRTNVATKDVDSRSCIWGWGFLSIFGGKTAAEKLQSGKCLPLFSREKALDSQSQSH
jgi:hypothetical protein